MILADGHIGHSPGCLAPGPGTVACSAGHSDAGGVGWQREGISQPWEGPFLQSQQAPGSKPERQEREQELGVTEWGTPAWRPWAGTAQCGRVTLEPRAWFSLGRFSDLGDKLGRKGFPEFLRPDPMDLADVSPDCG